LQTAIHTDAKIIIAGSGRQEQKLWLLKQESGLENVIFAGQITV